MRIFVKIIFSLLMLFFASIHYDYNVFAVNEFPAMPIEFNGKITLNNKLMPNNSIVYLYSNDIQENMLLATGTVINGMYFGINEKVPLYFTQSNIKNVIFKYSLPNSSVVLGNYQYTIKDKETNITLNLTFTNDNDTVNIDNTGGGIVVNSGNSAGGSSGGGGSGGGGSGGGGSRASKGLNNITNTVKGNIAENKNMLDINDHWCKDIIIEAMNQNIINGYQDNTFKPDNPITRAELLKIIFNAKGIEPTKDISDKPFNDVGLGYWDTGYIAKAKDIGLVSGYSNNIFKPRGLVNRAEGIKMILTAFNKNVNDNVDGNVNINDIFNDVPNDVWYAKFVSIAYKNGLVNGYNANIFKPENNITRAEALKIIMQIKNLNNKNKTQNNKTVQNN